MSWALDECGTARLCGGHGREAARMVPQGDPEPAVRGAAARHLTRAVVANGTARAAAKRSHNGYSR